MVIIRSAIAGSDVRWCSTSKVQVGVAVVGGRPEQQVDVRCRSSGSTKVPGLRSEVVEVDTGGEAWWQHRPEFEAALSGSPNTSRKSASCGWPFGSWVVAPGTIPTSSDIHSLAILEGSPRGLVVGLFMADRRTGAGAYGVCDLGGVCGAGDVNESPATSQEIRLRSPAPG